MTVGPKGTYLHTSIPGTGLYSRKKISNGTTGESSSSSLSNISFDHSDGSVFSGCLLSWPRFFIWVGIILLSLYVGANIIDSFLPWWEFLLFVSLIVGGLLGLWKMNGGDMSSPKSRRKNRAILWFSIAIMGFMLIYSTGLFQNGTNTTSKEVKQANETTTVVSERQDKTEDLNISNDSETITQSTSLNNDLLIGSAIATILLLITLVLTGRKTDKTNSFLSSSTAKKEGSMLQQRISNLLSLIEKEQDEEKRIILKDYRAHLMQEDVNKRLMPLIDKWQKKVARNPKPDTESILNQYQQELELENEEIKNSLYSVDGVLSESEKESYQAFCDSFQVFRTCDRTWAILSRFKNMELKSSAGTTVQKSAIAFKTGSFLTLASSFEIPVFPNSKGSLFFYPRFVIQGNSIEDFSILAIDKVSIRHKESRFIEDGYKPKDSKQVDTTYQYVNKNGGPDRRYSYNPMMPVLLYGEVTILPFDLSYQVSNNNAALDLERTFNTHKNNFCLKHTNNAPILTDSFSGHISEQYFNDLLESAKRLLIFGDSLAKNQGFCKLVEESISGDINWNGKTLTNPKEKIPVYLWIDIIRCYSGLGHDLDLSTNEGLGILMYNTLMIDQNFQFEYRFLDYIRKELVAKAENLTRNAVASLSRNKDVFLLEVCLKEFNKQLHNQYVVLLYRFASLVAKADKSISSTEADWLNKIISLKEPDGEEDIIKPIDPIDILKEKSAPRKQRSPAAEELNSLIGLVTVKSEINTLTNYIKVQKMRAEKGMKVSPVSYHCVFTGNPGTGKTTVARIVSEIYRELGILNKGHLVETDRSGLVAEYVGQTAVKTNKIIDSALDGVLFIDEAYSLVDGGSSDYGKEAISTLLKRMEDDRNRLVVILAGYTEDMKRFIESNPGLQSRFNRYIEFPDYTADELFQIFESSAKKYEYKLTEDAAAILKEIFLKAVEGKDKHFGNGRFVRNLFEKVIEHQANRISVIADVTADSLATIEVEDIQKSI